MKHWTKTLHDAQDVNANQIALIYANADLCKRKKTALPTKKNSNKRFSMQVEFLHKIIYTALKE